jgi:hypothetical protein
MARRVELGSPFALFLRAMNTRLAAGAASGDCTHEEHGATTSGRERLERQLACDPGRVRSCSFAGLCCFGRTKRAVHVCRRPEIDRKTPRGCRYPAPSTEDRPEKPVDWISGRWHLRRRHSAHRSRRGRDIFAEQQQDGGPATIGGE